MVCFQYTNVFMLVLLALATVLVSIDAGNIGNYDGGTWVPKAWTLQAELRVPEAGDTYGQTPVGLQGRGFITLISGYDQINHGIYVHTNDDGQAYRGRNVWSQQAKLVPADGGTAGDEFGRWIVSKGQTILVGAPYHDHSALVGAGAIYVFNGTLRHWTQTQKLIASDAKKNDNFGELISLNKDRVVVSAKGASGADFHMTKETPDVGACYIFERQPGGVHWSRTAKLWAKDMYGGNFFSEHVGVFDDWVVSTAVNDFEPGLHSGSAYMFKQTAGKWSQQQKLMAADLVYWQPVRDFKKYEKILGVKVFANDIALEDNVLAAGYRRNDTTELAVNGVYIFNGYKATNRWSLQQRLFTNPADEGTEYLMNSTRVKMTNTNNLVASIYGPNNEGNTYHFKTFGNGWSLQAAIKPADVFTQVTGDPAGDFTGFTGAGTDPAGVAYSTSIFEQPELHGGTLFHKFRNTNLIHSRFHNGSCLLLWMSDHFLDGWDSVVLTVRAPDTTQDTFHPHCDQVDPFYVRYCPYQPEDEGVYIIKTFAATEARFYWEISWQVQVEDTGIWYKGDYATKMYFNFNTTSMAFNFFQAENLVSLDRPCFRCIVVSDKSWAELQTPGGDSFWPLDTWNAPFYISDYEGRSIISMGNVCNGTDLYQCYQRPKDGYYILRVGGGLFGRETGLPYAGAKWKGCGAEGTDRDQLVFRIANGACQPIQVFRYTNRCSQPPPIDRYALDGVETPTAQGTAAPTVSMFGPQYVQYEMYNFDEGAAEVTKQGKIDAAANAHAHALGNNNKKPSMLEQIQAGQGVAFMQQASRQDPVNGAELDGDELDEDEHIVQTGKLDAFF